MRLDYGLCRWFACESPFRAFFVCAYRRCLSNPFISWIPVILHTVDKIPPTSSPDFPYIAFRRHFGIKTINRWRLGGKSGQRYGIWGEACPGIRDISNFSDIEGRICAGSWTRIEWRGSCCFADSSLFLGINECAVIPRKRRLLYQPPISAGW